MYRSRCARSLAGQIIALSLVWLACAVPAFAAGMATSGTMGVNQQGAATYSIPISVPPGIAGLSPKLSLEYNSQGGNGLLGVGWSLSGLSAITRCGATMGSDGIRSGVNYTGTDRFCMDGQKLMLVSGTYGAAGSVYRTELDGFNYITANGSQGVGPAWFSVKTKAGLTLQYGNTADSAVKALGSSTVRVWAINRVTDTVGNFMTMAYTPDATYGSYYPASISYTGNGSQAPTSSVQFSYTGRPDQIPLFTAGSLVKNTQLLSAIQTYAGGNLVKKYQLSYQAQTYGANLSVLNNVQEVFADGSTLPATQVSWPAYLNFASNCTSNCPQTFSTAPVVSISDTSQSYAGWQMIAGDLNGDGTNDLLGYLVSGTTLQIQAWLSSGNGVMIKAPAHAAVALGVTDASATVLLGDINGDGIPDVVMAGCNTQTGTLTVTTLPGNGDGTFGTATTPVSYSGYSCTNVGNFRLTDLSGNGKSNLLWVTSGPSNFYVYALLNNGVGGFNAPTSLGQTTGNAPPAGFTPANMQPQIYSIDVDNDGLQDLALLYANGNSIAVQYLPGQPNGLLGNPFTLLSYSGTPGNPAYTYSGNYTLQLADLNGDGAPDLIAMGAGSNGASADVWLNQGGGRFTAAVQQNVISDTAPNLASWTPVLADVNGDGFADAVYASANSAAGSTAATVFLGNGDGTFTQAYGAASTTAASAGGTTGWNILASDLSGRGRGDLVAWNPASSGMYVQTWNNALPYASTLVSSIANGIGASSSFTYSTLSNPGVYTKGAVASYPQINLNVPLSVVSSVASPDGVGGTLITNYSYSGLRAELYTGRGVLGFAGMTTTQVQAGNTITVNTTYNQSWPFTGLPESTTKTNSAAAGPGHQISSITNLYGCLNPQTGAACAVAPGNTYFPYASQTVEQSWDLNGTALPTVATTSNSWDSYGNVLATMTSTGDGYSKTTANTYTNDATNWYLGRLTQAAVTSVSPAGSATRTSAFTYNATTGLLASETIEPAQPQLCQTTSYGYDGYGNKTSATTANCAGASGTALFASRTSSSSAAATAANPVAGQFVTSSTNALNQSENKQYDARFGAPISLTGPNGLTTIWAYDVQGRATRETRADGNQTLTQYLYCAGVNGGNAACPTINGVSAAYVVASTPLASDGVTQNGAYIKTYFDGLNRKIRTETQGFDGTGSSTAIYQDTQYNSLGQAVAVSRPYYAGQNAYWIQSAYDALGRVTLVTQADSTTTSTSYNGLTTAVTNAKGQVVQTTRNSQAQVASVVDANQKTTAYAYDPLGNLTATTDVAGNYITLTYDLRGHKTRMVDPDMATWNYAYDALGQLVSQTDARGNASTMTYDMLGRMTSRGEADLISNWYYDAYKGGAACTMGIGKLCQATTSAGYNRVSNYDTLGRPSASSTTLDTTYTDSGTYDANGRLATRTYPGGVAVQYGYTALGYLQKVTRISSGLVLWQANAQDAQGHLLAQSYANGAFSSAQTFDPATGRITAIAAGPGSTIQNATYAYDSLGSVTSRNDQTQNLVETFTSDTLNRMQTSTVNASAASYTNTFAYDPTGNITSRSDLGAYNYQTVTVPVGQLLSCPTGSALSGTGAGAVCVFYGSAPAVANYSNSCELPAVLQGTNCVTPTTVNATVSSYTCPSGYTLNGTSCSRTTTTAATLAYSCSSAATINATTITVSFSNCHDTYGGEVCYGTSSTSGTVSGLIQGVLGAPSLSGSVCTYSGSDTSQASYTITSPPSWQLSGTVIDTYGSQFWTAHVTVPANPVYSCPSGGSLAGASCMTTSTATPTTNYTCSQGTLSGGSCNIQTAVAAVPTYTCATGTVVGTSCVNTTAGPAVNGSCPPGQSMNGSVCNVNGTPNVGPHALSLVLYPSNTGNRFFSYDANGNRTAEVWQSGTGVAGARSYGYTSFNMPAALSATTGTATVNEGYVYGPEHQRVKQASTALGTVYYLNPGNSGELFFEKELKPDNSSEMRNYITAGGMVVAEVKQITSAANVTSEQTLLLLRDNLGSTNVITDTSGNVLERLAYEPFGKRRQPAGPQDPNNALSDTYGQRGFTNHEHMDELGLINMNGRVYDPTTGRFLSADPYIQAAFNSQSYNRYSYGMNSPLNGMDPSGYSFLGDLAGDIVATWHDIWHTPVLRTAVVVAVAYFTGVDVNAGMVDAGYTTAEAGATGAAAGGFAGGFVASDGNFSAGLKGALTAELFYQVGTFSPYDHSDPFSTASIENVAGHAAVGCLSAAMSGGQCGSGAVSAGISDYASNNMPGFLQGSDNLALKTAYVSVIGGTTSVIAGGQFANGAETAAFGYLFNDLSHDPAWNTDQRLRNAGYLPTYYSDDGILCNGGGDGACGDPHGYGTNYSSAAFYGTLGGGGLGNLGPFVFAADSGVAIDSHLNLCLYTNECSGAGWNTPVGGSIGIVGSMGTGPLSSGTTSTVGGYAGQSQAQGNRDSVSYGRGVFGPTTGTGAGYLQCQTHYSCLAN